MQQSLDDSSIRIPQGAENEAKKGEENAKGGPQPSLIFQSFCSNGPADGFKI